MHIGEEVLSLAAQFIKEHTGLNSPESNHSHLRRILAKMVRTHGEDALKILERIKNEEKLRERFINEAMIGETYFFREKAQFHILIDHVVPELIRTNSAELKIWTASCSTGEEAISIAAVLLEMLGNRHIPFRVFAGDLNSEALSRIHRGRYPISSLRNDGRDFHYLLKQHITYEDSREFRIDEKLLSHITLLPLNLHWDSLESVPDELDAIFFRNTLIYAPEHNRRRFLDKVVPKLRKHAYFFVATSEVPFINHRQLEPVEIEGAYVFRKKEEARAHAALHDPARELASGEPASRDDSPAGKEVSPDVPKEGEGKPSEATLMRDFTSAMNSEDREAAEDCLSNFEAHYPDSVYTPFLRGLYFRDYGSRKEAYEEYFRALGRDEDFWPALYYLAEIYTEEDPHFAGRQFSLCLEKIDSMGSDFGGHGGILPILLDGFDVAYFRHLCERWIDKLHTRGEKYAHR